MQPRLPTLATILLALLLSSGCVYKMDIVQGNHIDAETVARVEPGMSRGQVQFVLGTPIVADPFHANRWDYVYFHKDGKNGDIQQRRFEVYFEDDVVVRVVDVGIES